MRNNRGVSFLFIIVSIILISYGCEDLLTTRDNRDKYTGEWAFKVYKSKTDLFLGRIYDTIYCYGEINKGEADDELTIYYSPPEYTVKSVERDGTITPFAQGWNSYGGVFESDRKLYLSISTGTNSRQFNTTIYGEKKLNSSVVDKPPEIITGNASNIVMSGASVNGILKPNYLFTTVSFEYGLTTDYGQSKKPKPDIYSGNEEMPVYATLYGLLPDKLYHFRVKAVNSVGTSYGNDLTFSTIGAPDPVTDIDGNVYNTAKIGTQLWMAENLRVTRFPDGTPIKFIDNQDSWNSNTEKAFCYYNDNPENALKYGAFYNWQAAMNGAPGSTATPSGVQGVCPTGWHLPSEGDWNKLEAFLGGSSAGLKMLAIEFGGTNESGFSAIPAGRRSTTPFSFIEFGGRAYFWTTTLFPTFGAIYTRMVTAGFNNPFLYKTDGLSVRCVKD